VVARRLAFFFFALSLSLLRLEMLDIAGELLMVLLLLEKLRVVVLSLMLLLESRGIEGERLLVLRLESRGIEGELLLMAV